MFRIFLLVLFAQAAVPTLSELNGLLAGFADYPQATLTSLPSFTYLKISTAEVPDNSKVPIILTSGLYAGYQSDIDFLFQLTNEILTGLNTSNATVSDLMRNKILYIAPLVNEAAYVKMQEAYAVDGNINIFVTDQTGNNCTNADAGTNVDHNFAESWTGTGTYADLCNTDYSGTAAFSSEIAQEIQSLITDSQALALLNFNRDGDFYFTPYSHDTSKSVLTPLQGQIYLNISQIVQDVGQIGNLFENTGESSSGTLLDFTTSLNMVALDIGVSSSFDLHVAFVFKYFALVDYALQVDTLENSMNSFSDMNADNTTSDFDIIKIVVEIQQKACIEMTGFTVSIGFIDSSETFSPVNASLVSGVSYNSSTSEEVLDYKETLASETNYIMDIFPFGVNTLTVFFERTENIGNTIDVYVKLTPTTQYFETIYSNFTIEGSDGTSSSSSSDSRKTAIIASSIAMIAVNLVIIIIAVVWKKCKGSDAGTFSPHSPTFSPKGPDKIT